MNREHQAEAGKRGLVERELELTELIEAAADLITFERITEALTFAGPDRVGEVLDRISEECAERLANADELASMSDEPPTEAEKAEFMRLVALGRALLEGEPGPGAGMGE